MKKICISAMTVACLFSASQALTLKETVQNAISNNKEIITNNLLTEASKKDIEIEKGAFKPTVDLTATTEKTHKQSNLRRSPKGDWREIEGFISTLSAEQLLYDGGKTPSKIDEKKYKSQNVMYNSKTKNEKIILDITKAYRKLVENDMLSQIYNYNYQSHSDAYTIAYNQEKISGSTLESRKTQSLIAELKDEKMLQDLETHKAKLQLLRLSQVENIGQTCKNEIDPNAIPSNLEEAIELAYTNNLQIQEQESLIKAQEQILTAQDSSYLPTVKAKLQGTYDYDIELEDNGIQKEVQGQLSLNWNLYNGGSDTALQEKEKIVLLKEKKQLSVLKDNIKESVTELYTRYFKTKTRIDDMKKNLAMHQEILSIIRVQLEDGTKTFSDELDSKTKVLETYRNLVILETDIQNTYYDLLFNLGTLSQTILAQNDTLECTEQKIANPILSTTKSNKNLDLLLDESGIVETNLEPEKTIVLTPKTTESLSSKLQKIYTKDYNYDPDTMTATFVISSNSFTVQDVNDNDIFHSILESFSPDFLNLLNEEQDKIDKVLIGSHTSSEFRRHTDKEKMYVANKGLSQRRANKVQAYFEEQSNNKFGDSKLIREKFEATGHGSDYLVRDVNNNEDKTASRRITIQVVPK